MDPAEIQAKATIAAVLITSRTVDIPSIPSSGEWAHDAASLRLPCPTADALSAFFG